MAGEALGATGARGVVEDPGAPPHSLRGAIAAGRLARLMAGHAPAMEALDSLDGSTSCGR
jgi:hypothetical protein